MVRRQESVTGWVPDCFPDRIHFGDFFFLFSIQGYGKDKPVYQLHCGKYSTFPFILCSVYSEPMAQVEFLSYYSFRVHFVVCGIPDSFANLQNLIHASACLYPDLPRPESGQASGPQLRGKIKHPKSQIRAKARPANAGPPLARTPSYAYPSS